MEDKNLTYSDLNEEERIVYDNKMPDSYYKYQLKGTVIHLGTAEQGHYYSFISNRESKDQEWYEFNDKDVKPFDPRDIPCEAFGGEDEFSNFNAAGIDQQQAKQMRTKIRNAYILIYERESFINMNRFEESMDKTDVVTNAVSIKQSFDLSRIPPVLAQHI